ncbi:hypothetical protein QBC32DRAFT_53097 [Pseudoneurospora amorphoporcata]|uniref:RRM domain-containing protein n=1 Tax=Pseudoneurospora amorphoporcata TaxID=241081 RepID=A0AAN6SBY8_9PEZI|nr:hypothetical protein QBC32DRAFT_53097 [Pseudoneurospora amorphoporcata]
MATRTAAPPAGLPQRVVSNPPNQTLYVANLPSAKIQKDDLRTALYMLFSTYGPVLDVVALKTMKMRGQAHIVYRDIQTATQAMRSLDGMEFLGRKMKITYAKGRSNIIAKLDGTLVPPKAAAAVALTTVQQSIFSAPVPGAPATNTESPAPQGSPAKPPGTETATPAEENRGTKRPREDEEEEESDSDVAMEEDSDED